MDARRRAVLDRHRWYDAPASDAVRATASDAARLGRIARDIAATSGLALVDVDRLLSPEELVRLASKFGTPIEEHDDAVRPFVLDRAVLRMEAAIDKPSVDLQPFSSEWISFHSEGSRRPAVHRPTWLLFQCVSPPLVDRGGQTLLRRAADIVEALRPSSVEVLRETVLCPETCDTTVVSSDEGHPILTFRDPAPEVMTWVSPAPSDEVKTALWDLLVVLYDVAAVEAVPWRRNRLVVLSNAAYLHARSSASRSPRVLHRVRVAGQEAALWLT
jgi:alpha-ketoglutarate-dependent taurine dioxygenase